MAPYEALYGRKCRSPICWDEVGETKLWGSDLVQQSVETVKVIRQRLLTAQSRQKSYADTRRRELEFQVGDRVFLKISPVRGIKRFGKKGKLSPRFIGPFEVLERIGSLAYRIALPASLSGIHDVFHVSLLRRYCHDPSHVLIEEPEGIQEDLTYTEQPVRILDRKEQVLRNKTIPWIKVLWNNHGIEEATWEGESEMRNQYPHLFDSYGKD